MRSCMAVGSVGAFTIVSTFRWVLALKVARRWSRGHAHVIGDSTTTTQQNRDVFAPLKLNAEMGQSSFFHSSAAQGRPFRRDSYSLLT